jgi:hypothetical protein
VGSDAIGGTFVARRRERNADETLGRTFVPLKIERPGLRAAVPDDNGAP